MRAGARFNPVEIQHLIRGLGIRPGLDADRRTDQGELADDPWWLSTLFTWLRRGWISGRQDARPPYRWIITADQAEVHRLAGTIQAWWPQIEAFILTGVTNAASEDVNRLIKLEARNAFGFRNPINQRLRSRCASLRAAQRRAKPG